MNKKVLIVVLMGSALSIGYAVGSHRTVRVADQTAGFHQSYFSQPQFFDQAFQTAALTPTEPKPEVVGIVLNHHLLAPAFIAETMNVVASDQPTTVVLVSPNHFDTGKAHIISSRYDWQTPYGVLPANKKMINQLAAGSLQVEEQPFENEHGIAAIVPFIKKTMPQASVVPIILKASTTEVEVEQLLNDIGKTATGRVIMVASVDFSHYLPGPVANFHDLLSKHVLRQFDFNNIGRMEIDSQPSIRAILRYAQIRGAERFQVLNHSNSATILGNPEIIEGTSYVTGYFAPGERVQDNHQTFLAVGDIQDSAKLASRLSPKSADYILAKIERLFNGSNQTYGNAPASNDLTKLGLNNNAIFTVLQVNAANDLLTETEAAIRRLLPKHVIVSVNWQGLNQVQRQKLSHQFIAAGSDLVMGHDTVVGPIEEHQGKLIVYSLGTLVPADLAASSQSLAVGVDIDGQTISYSLFPLQYKEGLATFIKPSESDILPLSLKQQIYGR